MPIIEQQLWEHWDDGLGASRDPLWLTEPDLAWQDDVDDFTAEYGAALGEIDRGVLNPALAKRALAPREQRAAANAARLAFEAAHAVLAPVSTEIDNAMLDAGRYWQEQARQGIDAADHLLA